MEVTATGPYKGMTRFKYRAARRDGKIMRGASLARDEKELESRLEGEGLTVLDVRPTSSFRSPKARSIDLAALFRNVAILVRSGVPVERALRSSEHVVPEGLRPRLGEVRALIRGGDPVADALERFPTLFPRAVIGTVRAGERGSRLADAFDRVAEHLEESAELRSQIRSALAYPILILVVGIITVGVICGVVVPRFADLLSDLGADLPAGAAALLVAVDVAERLGPFALLVGLLLIPVIRRGLRNPQVRTRLDEILLTVPVIGDLRLTFATARTCRALGGMLDNGMPLLSALEVASDATGDFEVSRRLERSRERVRGGTPLAKAIQEERALTERAIQLLAVGESSGRLAPMAMRAGSVAARSAQRRLRTVVSLVEPALVVALGGLVAGVSAVLLQAVYSVRPF